MAMHSFGNCSGLNLILQIIFRTRAAARYYLVLSLRTAVRADLLPPGGLAAGLLVAHGGGEVITVISLVTAMISAMITALVTPRVPAAGLPRVPGPWLLGVLGPGEDLPPHARPQLPPETLRLAVIAPAGSRQSRGRDFSQL